jgi:hypothetical protein
MRFLSAGARARLAEHYHCASVSASRLCAPRETLNLGALGRSFYIWRIWKRACVSHICADA